MLQSPRATVSTMSDIDLNFWDYFNIEMTPSDFIVNSTKDESDVEVSTPEQGFVVGIYSALLVTGALGNVAVFASLVRSRRRKSRVNLLMTHLAVADMIVTFIVIPLEIGWRTTNAWLAGNLACKFFLVLRAFGLYLSSNVLICISLDSEAVESLALAACESVDNGDNSEPITTSEADIPDLLTPISHSGATPLGCRRRDRGGRRVRPKSVAEQQSSSNEMLSLPPLHAEAADGLADLPANTLRHLVKGRPRRTKTRAPTRPITDQSQDIDEGLEEFWRGCRTPPGSEELSLSGRTALTSRSLHSLSSLASPSPLRRSPTLQRDDTMYSVTSGESTPVLLECGSTEVSRCKSSDNVGSKQATTPPPSRSSDNVNTMGNGCARTPGKARPWSVAGNADAAAAACTTGSMLRDHPLTPEGAEA